MKQPAIRPQRVVQRQQPIRPRKRIERDGRVALREQVEVLWARIRDVRGRVELPDAAELPPAEAARDDCHDVVCGGVVPRAVRTVGPDEREGAVVDGGETVHRDGAAQPILQD